jgi:magnesium transporter
MQEDSSSDSLNNETGATAEKTVEEALEATAPLAPWELLLQSWDQLPIDERLEKFLGLDRDSAEDLFFALTSAAQADLIQLLPQSLRRSWMRMLPLDDTADLIQQFSVDDRRTYLDMLDRDTRQEVLGLLAYAEDMAGGLMTPHFIRLRPSMTVEVAIRYLRAHSKHQEATIYYCYVVDDEQRLVGVVSFRELLLAKPERHVSDYMVKDMVSVRDDLDQEEVAKVFSANNFSAIPVVNSEGHLVGVVTHDDIAEAVQKEATEDIHKIGGMEALNLPYWQTSIFTLLRKRAGWLTVLFVGEMFTATAMSRYESEIASAVVLALFLPLIISSGGNSGSQASTLIIRAMALGEVRLSQWWRVLLRELGSGLVLGLILGAVGVLRVYFWPQSEIVYGPHYKMLALAVGASLIGVVTWGATAGSMLPFALRRLGLDPASASAPFVATLVDVTGIIIYFNVARALLSGLLM